ncbi:MAG: hemolysin secretion protein D [Legionellales bacterium RIFCSPHIGHO2_12_FULL_35_11]|nr:MAG: hemolysin secretion protein D [Legionellales bacterium RIFCSPHIGHO2_12_FULL_35_11]
MSNPPLGILGDSSPETLKETSQFSHIILWTIIICLIISFFWAKYSILDEVTSGQGKVIPSSQIQVIQNLEGGIVDKIYVKQGDIVKNGQILLRFNDTLFLSKFNEKLKKLDDLKIELIRLKAEINQEELVFPSRLKRENPDLVMSEVALFASRKKEVGQMKKDIDLASTELQLTRPLVSKGAASPVEVLRLERTVSELEGKLNAYNSQTAQRFNEAKGEYLSLKEDIRADRDRLTRTTVRSPVNGVIKQLKINTVGGVLKPGMDILEIVPMDDTLLIETKIRPSDVGFIHPNQKVMVKISAYDFSIYGGLDGVVEQISADTITDEEDKKKESYYIVLVRTNKNYLGTKEKPLYIIAGMQTTVNILTGRKSVLDYLLKPILKAKHNALRER